MISRELLAKNRLRMDRRDNIVQKSNYTVVQRVYGQTLYLASFELESDAKEYIRQYGEQLEIE